MTQENSQYFDTLETRSTAARAEDMASALPPLIRHAQENIPGYTESLKGVEAGRIIDAASLASLPVLRKGRMMHSPGEPLPLKDFIGREMADIDHVFQSPGPIYEPGMRGRDWWRFGRFLHALGVGRGHIVQNCFAYHFTPAGMMFESAAHAVGATVFPAGTGQTEMQAAAMSDLGVDVYAGTPDYLKAILEKGEEMGLDMSKVTKAAVSGGPLFPALREEYKNRGITCLQCYGTADVGHIAYESEAMEGMIVDEGVIVEIVTPGTGNPVPAGEIGEVLVTSLNPDFPMIRLATGDLSAVLPGESPCGRTNLRIVGWRGRADQATKVKGMFVRPEQVALLVARFDAISKARVTVSHDGSSDQMHIQFESSESDISGIDDAIRDVLKLRGTVEWCAPGSLPNDGKVIDDRREIG
ncbi:phenylacetate--CoA ligase family protein [Alphaproteobacteria bacterium LSUCC0684]